MIKDFQPQANPDQHKGMQGLLMVSLNPYPQPKGLKTFRRMLGMGKLVDHVDLGWVRGSAQSQANPKMRKAVWLQSS